MEKEKCSILFPPFPQVDSFVYENCSHNVDTFSEFCTGKYEEVDDNAEDLMMILNPPSGAKLLTTYEMHYNTIDNNTFQFIKGR